MDQIKQLYARLSFANVQKLFAEYETHLSAIALTAGFTFDSITLRRIDLWAENLAILVFICIAAAAILLMHLYNTGWLREISIFGKKPFFRADWWLPLVMQFAFGGLFSMFLVFYGRSGSFWVNWPFFLILIVLLVGNEVVRRYYRQIYFNTVVLYAAIFAYAVFALPLVIGKVNWWVYLLSGVTSIAIITLFIKLLEVISPIHIQARKRGWVVAVGGIFVLMNALYFLSIIPPIPLSLQKAEVAHQVQRLENGSYQVTHEKEPWYQSLLGRETVHIRSGRSVYFFSSVFAPTDLSADIIHRWQYKSRDGWKTASNISFPVVGGRQEGYRGYSQKQNLFPGEWRVTVLIEDGRVLGQKTFNISNDDTNRPMTQSVY